MTFSDPREHAADTERTIAEYTRVARARWLRDPFRQTLRIANRRAREFRAFKAAPATHGRPPGSVLVPAFLRPPSLIYAGYKGPWLEEYFFEHHAGEAVVGASYVPIFWDNFFAHCQGQTYLPAEFACRFRAIWRLLSELAATDRTYFTLLGIYDFPIWNWHRFPRNVLVLAGNGFGDIPIPLLKGDRPLLRRDKDIQVSFLGKLDMHPVRQNVRATFEGIAKFGLTPHWENVMARSHFSLCPRGLGPTSFRLFEALSVTSIPVYIWQGRRWLPYETELRWQDFSIVVEAGQMVEAKTTILNMPLERVQQMQGAIAKVYGRYFSYPGVARWIIGKMESITDRTDAEALTLRRVEDL